MDATETDDESIVGEAAHIVGEKEDGPRGISPLTLEQRNKYANLILLCNVDHKRVDDQTGEFTVDRLQEIKRQHIDWVRQQLGFDAAKIREDELYADYIEHWTASMQLDRWGNWASSIFYAGQPSLSSSMKEELERIRPWILSRIWPGRYSELEDAFTNFRHVAQDFCMTFDLHAEEEGGIWRTKRFYKIREWDPARYKELLRRYEEHVAFVKDLMLELTRSANYVCDRVRQYVLPSFRLKEGVLLVTSGPYMDLSMQTHRVEYRGDERTRQPYHGLESFEKTERFARDFWFGTPSDA